MLTDPMVIRRKTISNPTISITLIEKILMILEFIIVTHIKYNLFRFKTTQQAHHGQMTSKQRYINVDSVGTTLFLCGLTVMYPLG